MKVETREPHCEFEYKAIQEIFRLRNALQKIAMCDLPSIPGGADEKCPDCIRIAKSALEEGRWNK